MAFGKLSISTVLVSFALFAMAGKIRISHHTRADVPSHQKGIEKLVGQWYVVYVLRNPVLKLLTEQLSCIRINMIQRKNNIFNMTCNVGHELFFEKNNWTAKILDNDLLKYEHDNTEHEAQYIVADYKGDEVVYVDSKNTFIVMMSRNSTISKKLRTKYDRIFSWTRWSINRVIHNGCL